MAPTSCLTLLPPLPTPTPSNASGASGEPSAAPSSTTPQPAGADGASFDQQLKKARHNKAKTAAARVPAAAVPAKPAARKAAAPSADRETTDPPPADPANKSVEDQPSADGEHPAEKAADGAAHDPDPHGATTVIVAENAAEQSTPAVPLPADTDKPRGKAQPAAKPAATAAAPTPAAPIAVTPVDPIVPRTTPHKLGKVVASKAPAEKVATDADNPPTDTTDATPVPVNIAAPPKAGAAFGTAKLRTPGSDSGAGAVNPSSAAAVVAPPTPGPDAGAADDTPPESPGDANLPITSAIAPPGATVSGAPAALPPALPSLRGPVASPNSSSAPAASGDAAFTDSNHPNIAAAVHGQLLPNGGTLQIRLDPADLGSVQVTVRVRDGTVSATFETNNEDATRLLSHSLGELKSALESTGITVDRMHVQQAAKPAGGDAASTGGGGGRSAASDDSQQQARQEQQRRELLTKMWQRLSGGSDPLDLVA